ncbi:hypothetical protein C8R46DRAFT_1305323 [Mycena filopes]|nr:hypothetical protein C8R46DRAFT_1305323 [Mycena filopes]
MSASPLPMFHDGPVSHSHQTCGNCFQSQRSHASKLSRCARCVHVSYCSKKCQTADWPQHKQACKYLAAERRQIEEASGLPTPMQDFHEWVAYYNAPLQNCAVAIMELPQRPHLERLTVLALCLRHKRKPNLPVWDKFEVTSITRMDAAFLAAHMNPGLDASHYAKVCEKGKIELGDSYYGMGRYSFSVQFNEGWKEQPTEKLNHFAISKETARAQSLRADPWVLLREYINVGAKMKFCCGRLRIPGMDDICCCGGWVHDEEKRKAFSTA